MSLWKIAWRSIQRRGLASMLTTLSMALGVMLVVAVLLIHGIVAESFQKSSSLGYNVILGVKGGKLQLVLNSVFYLSQPIENVPWEFYEEFLSADQRADGVDGTYAPYVKRVIPICMGDYYRQFRVVGTTPEFFDVDDGDEENPQLLYPIAEGRVFETFNEGKDGQPGHGFFEAVIGSRVAESENLKVGDTIVPTHGSADGKPHDLFFIVGVLEPSGTPNDRAVFVNMEGFYLLDGHSLPADQVAAREFRNHKEHAVIGSDIAATQDLKIGDKISSKPKSAINAKEDRVVVGILEPTGTDQDQAILVNMDGYFSTENREGEAGESGDTGSTPAPVEAAEEDTRPSYVRKTTPLPRDQREVTSLLVRTTHPIVTVNIANHINESDRYQAVLPVQEITVLFDMVVSRIQQALLVITALICVVSGVGILVSIYNSMSDRTREIGIMRSLGAGRRTVMAIVLLEAVILAVGGGFIGWIGGHAGIALCSTTIERETGVQVGMFDITPPIPELRYSDSIIRLERRLGSYGGYILDKMLSPELLLIPTIVLLAVIVGFLPAVTAYKTDVAKSLSAHP
ncbi:ABC transporter permease [Planctomycetota bacterium]